MMLQVETLWNGVVLEASIQHLNHVLRIWSTKDFEMFEVAHVSLFIFSKCDVCDESWFVQLEHQVLGRSVGI